MDTTASSGAKVIVGRVDNKIRIPIIRLRETNTLDLLKEAATVIDENGDEIRLWSEDDERCDFCLPRGMKRQVENGFKSMGIPFSYSHAVKGFYISLGDVIPTDDFLRGYQKRAVEVMCRQESGVIKAPPGSGKTIMALAAIKVIQRAASLPVRSLVVVDRINLIKQWEQAAYEMGVTDVSVSTQQKLSLLNTPDPHKYDVVILDEMHHIVAPTLIKVAQFFSARFRWGLSATPERIETTRPIADRVIGPMIFSVNREELYEFGYLKRPKVTVIETNFDYPYKQAQRVGKRVVRSNYTDMMSALVDDRERNILIVKSIIDAIRNGYRCLVISKRVGHLHTLKALLEKMYYMKTTPMAILTGEHGAKMREGIFNSFRNQELSILFTTLAEEALDLPVADAIFLTYPARNAGLVEQQVGRIERSHVNKGTPRVFDFADTNVGVLRNQIYQRVHRVYNVFDYQVDWRKRN